MDVGKNDFVEFLSDNEQMCLVAYLVDIFAKLNELNTSLQGNNRHILLLSNKIRAFERKAQFWQDNLINGRFDAFSNLNSFINDNEDIEPPTQIIQNHLGCLQEHLASYFPAEDWSKYCWIQMPFQCQPETARLPMNETEQLIELSCDDGMKETFHTLSIIEFWFDMRDSYPELSIRALKLMVPFATSYLCESGFSSLVAIKTRYRSTMNVSSDLRCALSTTAPDFNKLCQNSQAHPSH